MKSFVISALGFIAFTCLGAKAEEPVVAPPQKAAQALNLIFDVQIVAIPQKLALPLVRELKDPRKIDEAWNKIQALLDDGTATLIGWPIIMTKGRGSPLNSFEAIHVIRYPDDFRAGGVGLYFPASDMRDSGAKERNREIDGTEFSAIPSVFQTRTIGVKLEIEATLLDDGKTINLNVTPEDSKLKGMRKVSLQRPGTGDTVTVDQPDFEVLRVSQNLLMKSGERFLLGASPITEPADHIEVLILHSEVRKLK